MSDLKSSISKELIEQKRNELLEKRPELKKRYEKSPLNHSQLQQNDLQCSDADCPIREFVDTYCCFKTPANIFPTDFDFVALSNGVTFDPTNLVCKSEPFCFADVGSINTSCGPIDGSYQVEVYAIRVTGQMPYVASFEVSNEEACPDNPAISSISCEGFACFDNIVCLSSDPNACPDLCLTEAEAVALPIIEDDCGSIIWLAFIFFTLPGCEQGPDQ